MVLTGISRILGFLRNAVTVWIFGGGKTADVINGVFSLPNGIRKFLAEGNLSLSYSALFARLTEEEKNKKAGNLVLQQLRWVLPLAFILLLFGGFISSILLPFTDTAQRNLSSMMLGPALLYIPFAVISSVPAGILTAQGKNHLLTLGSLVFSATVIVSLFFVKDGTLIYWAWSISFGGFLQLVLLLIFTKAWKWRFSLQRKMSSKSDLPEWITTLLFHLSGVIFFQIFIAILTQEKPGDLAAFTNAFTLLQFPLGIFINSLVMERYSHLTQSHTSERILGLTINGSLTIINFSIALIIFIVFLSQDIVRLLFEHGEFNMLQSTNTGQVLFWLSLGIPGYGLTLLFHRVYTLWGKPRKALVLGSIGQAVPMFLLFFRNPAIVSLIWVTGVSLTALLLFFFDRKLFLLFQDNIKFSLFSLAKRFIFHISLFAVLLIFSQFFPQDINILPRFLAGAGVWAVSWVIMSYILNVREIRFWEKSDISFS